MKKSATEILLPRTYKEVWKRGEEYVDNAKVRAKIFDDKKIEAVVKGKKDYSGQDARYIGRTARYKVILKFTKTGIIKQCDCAYSLGGSPVANLAFSGLLARPACKHMVAVAIYWDESQRILRPSKKDIDLHTIAPAPISRQSIINLFKNPLKADLDKLRIINEYTSWRPQPHARLPNVPKINSDARRALKIIEIKKAFQEMEKWTRRSLYDPYFCAGEMSAAFCELLDVIKKRMHRTNPKGMILIMALCVGWFYRKFNKLIDGIEGVWIFPPVRIGNLVFILIKRYLKESAWQEFNKIVRIAGESAGKKNINAKAIAEWRKEKLKVSK